MKATAQYGWPYPENGDHTRTWEYWEGQVKAIEATIRNGHTSFGAHNFGDATTAASISENWFFKEGADVYKMGLYIGPAGYFTMALSKNGVEANRVLLGPDGTVLMNKSGQPQRPLPYAFAQGQVAVPLTNAASAQTTVTLPAGRFTVAPIVQGTSEEVFYHVAVWPTASTSSFTVLTAHINATVATISVGARWLAIQMLPNAGAGLLAVKPSVIMIATCHTPECDNAGIPLEIEIPYEEGQPPPTAPYVVCGVCGEPIADVVPA